MKFYNFPLILLAIGMLPVVSSEAQSTNWYQESRTAEKPSNIGNDVVYEKLLRGKPSQTVVVAVIDSGVDIEHEDLKDIIWVNHDEVPDNGIDDDKNGYVDDINGWNFIGGPDGSQVAADTYEMTRLYALYREKYNDRDPNTLNKNELKEYNDFVKFGKRIEKESKKAKEQHDQFKEQYDQVKQQYELFSEVMDHIDMINKSHELNVALMDSLSTSFNSNDNIAANIFNYYHSETGSIPDVKTLRVDLVESLEDALFHYEDAIKHFGNKFKYNWNPDYDSRYLVGDNYDDVSERYYGNNQVEGPDAFHGTHVSGIIGAVRNNDIGINGIADNVRIMPIRAVPDGDERDKDIANAIRYAVENGASIINMSFGKGASPHKEIVDDAIRFAEKHDVLLVHASGNSSLNIDDPNDEDENYPNDYFKKPKGFLFFRKKQPKNYLSIGASGPTNSEDLVAEFSNYGKKDVDLFAPGVMMLSTVPGDKYEISQGTSFAAPVIAGVAAIIRSYFPTLTASQVKEAIMSSTTPIHSNVKLPGGEDLIPFSELSVTGGIINIPAAISRAARIKEKKRIKKKSGGDIKA